MKKVIRLLLNKNLYIMLIVVIYLFLTLSIYFFNNSIMGVWILWNIQKINSLILLSLFILMIINFVNFIQKTDSFVYGENKDNKSEKKELMFAVVRNILCLVPLILIKLFVKIFESTISFNKASNFEQLLIIVISFLLLTTIIVVFGALLFKFRSDKYNNDLPISFKSLIAFFAEAKKNEKSRELKNNEVCFNLTNVLVYVLLNTIKITIELFWRFKKIILLTTDKKYKLPVIIQV